jgi:hypothetical protein
MARGVCWSNLQDLDTVPDDNSVYILVFGAGTGSEGLYSLQERTKEDVPVVGLYNLKLVYRNVCLCLLRKLVYSSIELVCIDRPIA